jgi:hypothetical protein
MVIRPVPRPTSSSPSVATTAPTMAPPPAAEAPPTVPGPAGPPPTMTAPAPLPAPGAPDGPPVVAVAPCCPDVATFEGSKGGRSSYFGFDDKTNLVAAVGTDEYWLPPTKAKTLPGTKLQRDGARWVSVGVGKEAQVELAFAGTFTAACLTNCTFEVDPATVAEVVTTSVATSGVAFKIKGKAAGEASLKVICDGKLRGYFYIWCAVPVVLNLDVCTIKTANAPAAGYSLTSIQATADEIFSQSLISFSMRDLGIVDLTANAAAIAAEAVALTATNFTTTAAFTTAMHAAAETALQARSAPPPPPPPAAPAAAAPAGGAATPTPAPAPVVPAGPPPVLPRAGAYRVYVYIPTGRQVNAAGTVINIGASPAFSYFLSAGASENSIAHELGHSLGLRHPSDSSVGSQLPAHLLATKNVATTALAATNTEPAVTAAAAAGNIMAADPLNLMGYWGNKVVRKPIRYAQWKTCSRS